MAKRANRLGRGLSSLMKQPVPVDQPPADSDHAPAPPAPAKPRSSTSPQNTHATPPSDADAQTHSDITPQEGIHSVPVEAIRANPHQPRQTFDPAALSQLAQSIRRDGVMQPVILRPISEPSSEIRYELVAGERRWRAAQQTGLETIPSIVRDLDEHQVAEWALVENLQREDLDAIERAEAFQHLIDRFALSHEEVAERVGVDRSTISNALRLLQLAPEVQQLVRDARLSAGHAKALAGIGDAQLQTHLATQAVKKGWSVRRLEAEARRITSEEAAGPSTPAQRRTTHLADLEEQLTQQLATKVQIKPGRKKNSGALVIEFYSLDEFDGLLNRLGVNADIT